jgi:exodeoxyribonuclease VII large subunit
METTPLSVHDAVALINQTLEYAYPTIVVEGEVSSFKVNQQKYVFFDIKDERATLNCFMMVFQLRTPIEDGMRVRVVAQPKITQWGKFSLTVREVQPVGEGNLKRSFELLYAKLDKEGLFAAERKRSVPSLPGHIAVISSTQAAGYADFIKILNERWGGVEVTVAHTVVQGIEAPKQIIQALSYLNQLAELPDVIVIVRGGGSLDDLSAFNDEPLVRAIATSRVPVVTGIGHKVDTTLADLAADRRAATPSNAAMLVVPDRQDMVHRIDRDIMQIVRQMECCIRDF